MEKLLRCENLVNARRPLTQFPYHVTCRSQLPKGSSEPLR